MNIEHAGLSWSLAGHVAIACIVLLAPPRAEASHLHMVPSTQVRMEEDAKREQGV